ncbi:phosphohistidine phosphatase SixA [Paraglaciecola sp. MB-3u-78]|jgi:phosphohistidine phosphatase|uniref:phosphohistidine phosphatase SixA n=1 Tax=Paraglaciecola sp. MB-3u-78 TaxID=2058332 RepID=UPI000C337152|nr:phosphohistidine phosphatase SixA [Paraglaciecola sp. MB-3u-78]PKH00382.1 phosphohistidine phosphatase SixA [Paraglaciecola sp. MB-3u-78]
MKLIIMRHGEAERFREQDNTRSLTSLGEKQAITAGKWLYDYLGADLPIDIALVSSYVRAQQTYEQLSEHVVVIKKQICEDVIPEGDPKVAHDFIKVLYETASQPHVILVVSHMPFVSYFLEEVLFDKKSMLFDTSSVVIVDYDLAAGAGTIESIYHPV